MVTGKMFVVSLVAICLITLFMTRPSNSLTATSKAYNPWGDLNDDGKIDGRDFALMIKLWDTQGAPVNKTQLLYNVNDTFTVLLSRIYGVNASLLEEEAYLETRIASLESLIANLQSITNSLNSTLTQEINDLKAELQEANATITELKTEIVILNATKLGIPYDSFWYPISKGGYRIFPHNLGTTNVLVYMIGYDSETGAIHQKDYGGEKSPGYTWGCWWTDLTATDIRVERGGSDDNWDYVRLIIWKIP
jgi:hypothetical protein